jgi:hypothetical protein
MFRKKFSSRIKSWNKIVLGFPRSIWNDSSLLSDVLKDHHKNSKRLKFLDSSLNYLKEKHLTNLGEWKKLSRYAKMRYPEHLRVVFEKYTSKFKFNLTKGSPLEIYKDFEKDYLETIENEPKIEGWSKDYIGVMSRYRDIFYNNIERNFPSQYNQSLPLDDIKDYVKQKFPNLNLAKGYTDKQTQKELFGPFYKENVEIPINDNMVCMQYSGLYPNLWLDFQRKKIEKTKVRNLDVLMDISGIGKTFNILGTGTKQYLILCSGIDEYSHSQMKDNSFLKLVEEINYKRENPGELISETPRLIYSFLFSRLMHLWLLLEYYPKELTPKQYILNQLNESNIEMTEFCIEINSFVNKNHLSNDDLHDHCFMLMNEIINKTRTHIGFALDEASEAEKSTKDLYYSWKGEKSGMLSILLETLFTLNFNYMVFVGVTNYSFSETCDLCSSTAKQGSLVTKIVTDFELIPSIKDYLALHLDISECENIFNDDFLMKMSNQTRGRFGGTLIKNISDTYRNNSNLSKEEILRKAIIQTYQQFVDEIFDKLEEIHNQENSKKTIQVLIDLYGFSKSKKNEKFLIYDEKLMEIGIAKIKLEGNNISFTKIDECAVIEAIDKFLEQHHFGKRS